MKKEISFTAVILSILLAIVGSTIFVSSQTSPAAAGIQKHMGPADIYPHIPGTLNPNISQNNVLSTICNPKWSTKSIRPSSNYTTALKIKQIEEYGYIQKNPADYEEDHLISLELGGNPTDPNNLWPEPYTASISDGGARTKDQVENYLKRQVCAGTMTLAEAQKEISTDWYAVYVHNLQGKFGSVDTFIDEDDE